MSCFVLFQTAGASHLEGGELFYNCTGNNTYHITLKLYRNCFCTNCANLADTEYVTIFDATGHVYTQLGMPKPDTVNLPSTFGNPCMGALPAICATEADYTGDAVLPPATGGYTIVYQRCCRDNGVVNLVPGQGATFTAEVPDSSIASCNSSARFSAEPPIYVCLNNALSLSYAATDPDGDSLTYSLCNPFSGADGNCPDPSPNGMQGGGCPSYPSPPPYLEAIYTTAYDSSNFTNNPYSLNNITIDPHTGILTGIPNQQGLYDITVCVSEYRNGQLLNTLRRDFEIAVVACNSPLASLSQVGTYNNLPINQIVCSSKTVNFSNAIYNSSPPDSLTYLWDFGVPGAGADTSNLASPSFTYPDTGKYLVHFVVRNSENGQNCSDTAAAWVFVYPSFGVTFSATTACVDSLVYFDSQTISTSGPLTSIIWDFGDNSTSSIPDPVHSYRAAGTYFVTLTEQNSQGCSVTVENTVHISGCVNSISSISEEMDLSLYPNPVKDITFLHYNVTSLAITIQMAIYDQLGQLLMNKTLPITADSFAIDVRDMANGVYNYCLMVNGQVVMHNKFLVLK